jgi:chromate transporter
MTDRTTTDTPPEGAEAYYPKPESYIRLFWRFLHFGLLAWGGPVPQIAMIREELVARERWVSPDQFNRALAVYQVLPGPEAHELCVYFGMVNRGRWGGLLAGLGFMLPGFILMFALSWFYVAYRLHLPFLAPLFFGAKAAVAALIVRAVHRLGQPALADYWLWAIALVGAACSWLGAHFLVILPLAGLAYSLCSRERYVLAALLGVTLLAGSIWYYLNPWEGGINSALMLLFSSTNATPSLLSLFFSGLRAGLLTFGGAYTVIPFLQHDAVTMGGWMTNAQFLDGLALSGIIPAPLIIFATFIGYLGGGPWGAVALTVGIFFPAFAFTLVGHTWLEKLISHPGLHNFNVGVTAGVIGLIAVTGLELVQAALVNLPALGIFAASLVLLYRWHAKIAALVVVLGAGGLGLLFALVLK